MKAWLTTACLLLASAVWADINDGGSLNINNGSVLGSLNMSGSSSTVTTASSVTASAFFGDGSHLTGLPTAPAVGISSYNVSGQMFSTTAGSYQYITGSSATVTTVNTNPVTVDVTFPYVGFTGTASNCTYVLMDNGSFQENGAGNGTSVCQSTASHCNFHWHYFTGSKSAGSYTFSVWVKNDSIQGCTVSGGWAVVATEGTH